MGLLKSTPDFESDDNTNTGTATTAMPAAATTAKPDMPAADKAADPAATVTKEVTTVGVSGGTALAKKSDFNMNAIQSFKDALPVDYNTLNQIIASNGALLDRETKTSLGDTLVFELLSFQDSFVVSPEDDDAPNDMVRYSNDGVTCSDGTSVEAHLEFLHGNGFPKARLKERVVVVGAIESAAKSDKFNGTLVQLDLSPASRVQWKRFQFNVSYGIKIQKYKPEQVNRIRASTTLAQGSGNDTFTLVQFEVAV